MKRTEIHELLAEHPFFAGLEPGDRELIAGCGTQRHVPGRLPVAHEGDDADRFFVLRDGRVAIEVHAPGRGSLVVATASSGDVVGWSWIVPPHRWRFDVRAVTDVHAVALDGACLRGKCEADPALGYRLMKRFSGVLVERLEATRLRLLDVYGAHGSGEAPTTPEHARA
ncbi:MAG: hypothetical protein KatS3mg010_1405 [Acidimicrobiia bacterium]|nr:MAG: hypothetical protein KatS3mg010_1405 [Acidimicrobiia bacterium]